MRKTNFVLIALLFLSSTLSEASSVVSVGSGINFIDINQSSPINYSINDNLIKNNWNGNAHTTQGMAGIFVGAELPINIKKQPFFIWQFGLAYYTPFSDYTLSGITEQGIPGPQYTYSYSIQSSQLLFDNKFLMMPDEYYHPYLSAGIGIANNRAYNYQRAYNASYPEYSLGFADNMSNSLSYELGFGLDLDLDFIPHLEGWRFGIGYRYINLGTVSSGIPLNGTLPIDNSIRLKQSLASQQILAQLSYIF
jgi:opacity protein-like surface antigen